MNSVSLVGKSSIFLSRYCLFFLMVITSNLMLSGTFLVSDVLYGFLSLLIFCRVKKKGRHYMLYTFLVYFILASIVNYYVYSNIRGLQSCLRFVYNLFLCITFITSFNNNSYRIKVINGYINACTIFSLLVILQFLSFYLLRYNLDLSLGELEREANLANVYDPSSDLIYRTGGLFKEPSHFAAFVAPSIFMCHKLRYIKRMYFVVCGILLSTSGLGFVALFLFSNLVLMNANKKTKILYFSLVVILLITMPFLLSHIQGGGSYEIRVAEPFNALIYEDGLGLFGGNPSFHYSGEEVLWINTFVFICLYFGIIGIILFLRFIYYSKLKYLTAVLISIIVIEGIYGRIDFWLTILVCYLFNKELQESEKGNISYLLGHSR